MDSYGYVETLGLVTAIEAADAALKAANVTLMNCYYVKGGIVTIEVAGDVAAVNAAVDAASESARRLGNFLSCNVIARVASETKKILISDIGKKSDKKATAVQNDKKIIEKIDNEKIGEEIGVEEATNQTVNIEKENQFAEKQFENIAEKIETEGKTEAEVQEITENTETKKQNNIIWENKEISMTETLKKEDEETKKIKKQYQEMKVADLKTKVNSLKLGYTWNQIKTMTKKKLVEILMKNNKEE
jgi:microcompartments protein